MQQLLNWLWSRVLLFALLVVVIGASVALGPTLTDLPRLVGEEAQDKATIIASIDAKRLQAQREFDEAAERAKNGSLKELEDRIRKREADLLTAKAALAESGKGLLAEYRPNKILEAKQAEIDIFVAERELELLKVAKDRRKAANYLQQRPKRPTEAAVKAAQQECTSARKALAAFEARAEIAQLARDIAFDEQDSLLKRRDAACKTATKAQAERKAHLEYEKARNQARAEFDRLAAMQVPQELAAQIPAITSRDILWKAFLALLTITLTPFLYRTIAYYLLAPLAERWPPIRFAPDHERPPPPVATPSAISQALTLGPDDEVLVRQDYLQASPTDGQKDFRWLLDWRHFLVSLTSGMRFLTAIRSDAGKVTVSAVKDPFAELAVLALPEGAACMLRPSALAAVVQPRGKPMRIKGRWRFSLPALLTWQWRYYIFHGPVQLVIKGARGVRIEPAQRGRIVGEGQILGCSTDLAYSVIRSETFPPYFFGREALLKDRVEAGGGVVLIEEAPSAGKSGSRRGIEGVWDAALKLFGV